MIELINNDNKQTVGSKIEQLLINCNEVQIISPYLSDNIIIDKLQNKNVKLLTKFSISDCIQNPSHLIAIKKLITIGVKINYTRNLHSKIYLFDDDKLMIGSSNFTENGLFNNIESNVLLDINFSTDGIIFPIIDFIDDLWKNSNELIINDISKFDELINKIKLIKTLENIDKDISDMFDTFIEPKKQTKSVNEINNNEANTKKVELSNQQKQIQEKKSEIIDNTNKYKQYKRYNELTDWENDVFEIISNLKVDFTLDTEFSALIDKLDYSAPLSDLAKKDRDAVSELLKLGNVLETNYNNGNEDERKAILSNVITKATPPGALLSDDDDDGYGVAGILSATNKKANKGLEVITVTHIGINLNARYYKTEETGQVNIVLCVLTQSNGKKIPGAVYVDAINDGTHIVFNMKVSGEIIELAKILVTDVPKYNEAGLIAIKLKDDTDFLAAKKANGNPKECKFSLKGSTDTPTTRIYIPFKSLDLT